MASFDFLIRYTKADKDANVTKEERRNVTRQVDSVCNDLLDSDSLDTGGLYFFLP